MKLLYALTSLCLLIPQVTASIPLEDAADRVYWFAVYDFDVDVWGQGKGYIAPDCKGTGKNNRCTFNEFQAYVETGSPSPNNNYADLAPAFTFSPGSVGAITFTIRNLANGYNDIPYRLAPGVKGALGVWNKLGFALTQGQIAAAAGGRGDMIERHLGNARLTLQQVIDIRSSIQGPKTLDALKSRFKDIVWESVERQSQFTKSWQEVEWEKSVAKYPELAKPGSDMFQKLTLALNELHKDNSKPDSLLHRAKDAMNCIRK